MNKAIVASLITVVVAGCKSPEQKTLTGIELVQAAHTAVELSLPASVVMDQKLHSIMLAPTLALQNTSSDTLGILSIGSTIQNLSVDYDVSDSDGKKVPAIRTNLRRQTLAGSRVSVSLLKPGKSITWDPEEAISCTVYKKDIYRLIAHVQVAVPDLLYEHAMLDSDRSQITATVHRFDSEVVTFIVK